MTMQIHRQRKKKSSTDRACVQKEENEDDVVACIFNAKALQATQTAAPLNFATTDKKQKQPRISKKLMRHRPPENKHPGSCFFFFFGANAKTAVVGMCASGVNEKETRWEVRYPLRSTSLSTGKVTRR